MTSLTSTEQRAVVDTVSMDIEALLGRNIDALELVPVMGYDTFQYADVLQIGEKLRPQAHATDEKWIEYANRHDGNPFRYLDFTKSFKFTVNPRFQIQFLIWTDVEGAVQRDDYDDLAALVQTPSYGTGFIGNYGLRIVLNEGDFVEYDDENKRFVLMSNKEIIVDKTLDLSNDVLHIGTLDAAYYQPSDEQIDSEGLLDDPLTPEDESVDPSTDTAFSDRIARIKRELKFKNRGGRRMLGGLALLGIAIGLLYFFTKSKIVQNVKPSFDTGIEGGIGVE